MKKISRLAALLAAFVVPLLAAAQSVIPSGINTSAITPYSSGIINTINYILVPVLIAIAFIVFLWGVYKSYIYSADNETERSKGHQITLWGIIGFVVIVSLWGLVNLIMSTFGLSAGGRAPQPPTIWGTTGTTGSQNTYGSGSPATFGNSSVTNGASDVGVGGNCEYATCASGLTCDTNSMTCIDTNTYGDNGYTP